MSDEYDNGHEFFGIALPDHVFGMFETGNALRWVRRVGIVVGVVLVLVLVVLGVRYVIAAKQPESPMQKAQEEVTFLETHHGTDDEICAARQKLVQIENEAMVGDGDDLDHLMARTCLTQQELNRRLGR